MPRYPLWKTLLVFFVLILFGYFAFPSFLSESRRARLPESMQGHTVNLGLDLRGGVHLLLEIDFAAYFKEQGEILRTQIRNELRDTKLGYRDIAITGDNKVTFRLPDNATERGGTFDAFKRGMGQEYDITEDRGFVSVGWTAQAMRTKHEQLIDQSIEIVERRVNDSGTKEPIIQRQGEDRIVLQVPGLENPEALKAVLGQTAKMTFHLVDPNVSMSDAAAGKVPLGTVLMPMDASQEGGGQMKLPVYSNTELTGELLTGASVTFQNGEPVVSFQFNQEGARRFGEITQANIGRRLAVVLDDKVITSPTINGAILGGSGIITGNFTIDSANNLALLLRAGALPAPLKILEERSVGPSLGADSIADGERASLIGLLGVVAFMVLGYGLFGIFSIVALICNIILLVGALGLFQATLTLPGIAGIVLTFGMAVDANVLIYERIREEVGKGRSPISAVESGFKLAFGTIVDAHMTSLIAAGILYELGTGTIKGFAVTLALGIISSLFTAILVTRMQIAAWFRLRHPKRLPI